MTAGAEQTAPEPDAAGWRVADPEAGDPVFVCPTARDSRPRGQCMCSSTVVSRYGRVTRQARRRLIDVETHIAVFTWVLERLSAAGLVRGKTVGVDAMFSVNYFCRQE